MEQNSGNSHNGHLRSVRRNFGKFLTDKHGGIAMMSALVILVLVVSVGSAVDYARAVNARSSLADALDAAVVSVAKDLRDQKIKPSEAKEKAKAIFESNIGLVADRIAGGLAITNLQLAKRDNFTDLLITASARVPTTFMNVVGITELPISLNSRVSYSIQEVEVTLVLDVTGSMSRNGRITNLKKAATDLINTLVPASGKNKNVRISIVPYSQGINAGTYAKSATKGVSTSCATERVGINKYNDNSFSLEPIGNGSTYCPRNKVRPLTNSNSTLVADIAALRTGGYTAGHTGIAWGWYTLSPNWGSLWPSASKPGIYDPKITKIAVIMTDGAFNTAYVKKKKSAALKENKGSAASLANTRAKALCREMKRKNVKVYSIAFQAGSSAEAVLLNCATSKTTFYKADDGDELIAAFRSIATDIDSFFISM